MTQKLTRRTFMKQAGLAGIGLALASCATPAAQPAASSDEAGAPSQYKVTEIIAPSWWAPHEIEGAEASFNSTFKEQTGLTVKYDFIGSDFDAKVFTNLASGTPYDVITFNADRVPQYLERGILRSIDDLVERDGYDLSNFVDGALEQWTHDGELYGLTADMGSFHCYFNKALFEAAGLEAPSPLDDWSWDDLLEWSKALTVRDGDQITQYGFAADTNWNWEIWPNTNGEYVFDEGITKSLLDSDAAIQAYDFYQSLMYEENVAVKPGSIQTGVNELFLAGQLAIMMNGTWQVGWLRSKKEEVSFNWDVGVQPYGSAVGADGWLVPNFTAGWVIPNNAPDVDASWEAVKFYAGDTFAEDVMFTALSGLPTTKSALDGAWYAQWPDNPPEGLTPEFYGKLLEHGAPRRHLRFDLGSEVNASMNKLELIYSNEEEPANLLPGLAEEVNAGLATRPWNS
ncbi:MAG: substrate-binding domain-containing protein [Chloroflexota bacterium]